MTHTRSPRRAVRSATAGAVLAAAVALTSCSGAAPQPGTSPAGRTAWAEGGTLTIALNGTSTGSLDPTLANTLVSVSVIAALCDPLYDESVDGKLVPQLAERPQFSSDRTTATVKIRSGVTFTDGTAMDADAVKQTFERNKTLKGSQRAGDLEIIKDIQVVDPTTLKFVFDGPTSDGAFQDAFVSRAAYPLSPKAFTSMGAEFATHPVCVGGFVLDSQTTDTVTLKRDPAKTYYDQKSLHLDSIVFKVVADPSVRYANLQSGQFDVIQDLSPKDLSTAKSDSSIDVTQYPGRGYVNILLNPKTMAQPLVRKAFAESIDRKAISKAVWEGVYTPACTFIQPQSPMADPKNQACIPYDPAQAKKDLAAAGVTTPVKVVLEYSSTPERSQLATLVQAMAKQTGFEVSLKPTDTASVLADTRAGRNDAGINSYTGGADPISNLMLTPGAFLNSYPWNDDRVNALYDKILVTPDPAQAKPLYDQIQEILNTEVPVVYIAHNALIHGIKKAVKGLNLTASDGFSAMHAGFAK
ncbi:ABC transporter substrate-binding protein [Microbacterium sp. ASV81]|uniref:ABC transporter substrate-binding protein n=1 Tax=Microbacterium capsulatum TaxID=3041921 RepID=A0ABU0XJ68_9MICO|nr:ABC transporter substrate-binding protein [Microbacterium sp. ASV81]MDQ4214699.1 ABC transporter substrate-binding protein [Microbacterium sp. ASV81]